MLETRDLRLRFGGHVAVDGVSCAFRPGTLTAIVGPGGAGKTSLLDLISGQQRPESGTVHLGGVDITGAPIAARTRRGLGRGFQVTQLFPSLSVLENVRLAVQSRRREGRRLGSVWSDHRNTLERAHALVERVDLGELGDAPAVSLPHSGQRKLEVAMLMALEPKVYLFDEPTAGMAVADAGVVLGLIRDLKAQRDKTILLVEHRPEVVAGLADRIVVMARGRVIADDEPDAIVASPAVQRAWQRLEPAA